MSARFDCEIVTGDGSEERYWLTRAQVIAFLGTLKNGEDMTIHRTDEDADPEAIYP